MEEATAFDRVVTELRDREYEPLVHVPEAHADTYADVLDRCRRHEISIRGRYPDVLGFTDANRVFAVEVKGSSGILRGIGQALTYQYGAHVSYLAAEESAVASHGDLLGAKGVGAIGVGDEGVSFVRSPPAAESARQVADVEGQLSLHLQGAEFGGDVTTLSLTQPLNYLAPVVAVDRRGPLGREALLETIEDEYSFQAGSEALAGAETLGLLASSRPITLTDQGELAATVLRGYGIETLDDLRLAKENTRGSTVVEIHHPIAILLRNSFSRHPAFGLLLEALRKEGEVVYFPELLERLVREYPNVFLSAFCTTGGREQARELIERGESERLYQDRGVWTDVVRNNVLFNFVQQLKHVGVLAPETRSHGGAIDEYDPDEKPWFVSQPHDRGVDADDT
ncbi:Uncharacterized protein AArcCO_0574 [Halalkaliarchaeum sp. AArc-CO]|uniref:hypothetical protein n=1 Tax=unclassified Halalkaliarchaeum TaxID=2678344 RepID=UPI00217D1456|nr:MULTISPECIES: hypothetical protein [unclassified Halalkaliarchaeum]MDR5674669.1 hypothetical protein [Halalkaliarchaeum sp. AArc-GB]UWG49898.1 Uncharacterized protein AArcCO_0574 [Halalkaliarchaeum sp. AArc-CO]